MSFGLTPFGFNAKRVNDVKTSMDDTAIAQFGDINLDAQSVFGQIYGSLSKVIGDNWENLEDVYYSQYPNFAEGVSLDNVVQINGIVRLPARQTEVTAIANGVEATFIPSGSLARIPETQEVFYSTEDAVISRNSAVEAVVEVVQLADQVYTVLLNNNVFSYSLPIITFTGNFVTGNNIVVTLNGVVLATVPFNTDNNTTLADIATVIQSTASIATATPTNPNIISIIPNLGFNAVVNFIEITGGASQPTYAITYDTPATLDDVATYLSAVINAGSEPVTASSSTSTLSLFTDDYDVPFSLSVGTNLLISNRSSIVYFNSQNFGPVPAPIETLTEILTPLAGWTSINNFKAGVLGRFVETDAELRLRRANSTRILGSATVEAIRARLLQQVPNVTSALVYENIMITQEDINIIFSEDFVASNEIIVNFNGVNLPTITYAVSSINTMNLLASLISVQSEISSATVGGASNRTITLEMNNFQEVEISNIQITGGASQTSYTITGGRHAKSFESVVQGGTDEDIAKKIWETKPAGIETFGNTQFNITDSQGDFQAIFFSRPTPIYISVTVTLTLNTEETFPSNGLDLVKQAILDYGNSLGVGLDVFIQRVNCQIFEVQGVAGGVMQLAQTNSPNDSPSFSTDDIVIDETQISDWNLSRILVTI